MRRVPEGFCIDMTEVTRDQYNAWLSTSPLPPAGDVNCGENTTFTPSCAWTTAGALPAVCVDWCDATAYCQAVGKYLCGSMTGGTVAFADYDDPTVSQWFNACTSDGLHSYTYGDAYDPAVCNGYGAGVGGPAEVGIRSGCQSLEDGFEGVFDLSGNVWEWDNTCNGVGWTASCRYRGGNWGSGNGPLACDGYSTAQRSQSYASVGFRCCAD
jgi:formylglycine-generating enzyme